MIFETGAESVVESVVEDVVPVESGVEMVVPVESVVEEGESSVAEMSAYSYVSNGLAFWRPVIVTVPATSLKKPDPPVMACFPGSPTVLELTPEHLRILVHQKIIWAVQIHRTACGKRFQDPCE